MYDLIPITSMTTYTIMFQEQIAEYNYSMTEYALKYLNNILHKFVLTILPISISYLIH